jgi:hypothetical protein
MQATTRDTLTTFLTDDTPAKVAGFGVAAAVTLLWQSLTGILAYVLVGAFLIDVSLGLARSIAREGINSFSWRKFGDSFVRLVAAVLGIVLFTLLDVLVSYLRGIDLVDPITAGGMVALALGFLGSAAKSLSHFYPPVGAWIEGKLRAIQPMQDPHPHRRSDDHPDGPGGGGRRPLTEAEAKQEWARREMSDRMDPERRGGTNGHARYGSEA